MKPDSNLTHDQGEAISLYIHVPFCRRKCSYCDFYFSTNRKRQSDMVDAMVREIELRKDFGQNNGELRTVYLGGGTPSVLESDEFRRLFGTINGHFSIQKGAEITLEANPEDLTEAKLQAMAEVGINRLSIGLQSFYQDDLDWMNRAHSPEQVGEGMALARSMGISNITLDLMFGLPGLSMSRWESNIEQAVALEPDHVSLYALSVEKKTALRNWVKEGKMELPPDELVEAQYLFANNVLWNAGFEHYELSSFAQKEKQAQHNSAYWRGLPYLGIGPSAHSFDGDCRSWNIANNSRYIDMLSKGELPVEEVEELSEEERLNEYVMTRLRLQEGLSLPELEEAFEVDFWEAHAPYIDSLLRSGQLWRKSDRIGLTPRGWIVSDSLIAEFFV
ncbi:MAG: radical SAM family heme chaperone HemW [Bacteroidia bacterium]